MGLTCQDGNKNPIGPACKLMYQHFSACVGTRLCQAIGEKVHLAYCTDWSMWRVWTV